MTEKGKSDWLTGFLLGAASTASKKSEVEVTGWLTSPKGKRYGIIKLLGETSEANLYQCLLPNDRLGILKIATNVVENKILDNEGLILSFLRITALDVEENQRTGVKLNYHYFFPNIEEGFICEAQQGRRVNVLSFPDAIIKISQLTPLSSLIERENVYVDPRTGAWIFGKILKILAFANDDYISNGSLSLDTLLIERNLHGLIVFDWSLSKTYNISTVVSPDWQEASRQFQDDLATAARVCIEVMGGKYPDQKLPKNKQLENSRYEDFLWLVAGGKYDNAVLVHKEFYQLIWDLWPKGFHPFTAYSR